MSGAEHQTADAADIEYPENAQDNQDLKSPPARGTGKKALAVFGAGALLAGGGIFAYNSLHQSEEAFSADGEEYAQVCQDSNTGLRVEDEQCEKAEKEAGNTSSDSSSGSSGDSHSGTQNSGNSGTTHQRVPMVLPRAPQRRYHIHPRRGIISERRQHHTPQFGNGIQRSFPQRRRI